MALAVAERYEDESPEDSEPASADAALDAAIARAEAAFARLERRVTAPEAAPHRRPLLH